jgi:hypothetical protein
MNQFDQAMEARATSSAADAGALRHVSAKPKSPVASCPAHLSVSSNSASGAAQFSRYAKGRV